MDDLFPEHLAAGGDFGDEGVDGVLPRAVGCDGEDALAIPGGILGELAEDVEVAVAVGDGAFDQAAFLRGAVAFCPVEVLGMQFLKQPQQSAQSLILPLHISSYEPHVLSQSLKQGSASHLREHSKLAVLVLLCCLPYHRGQHRHIAQG